jgi:hypothetical protein
MPVHTALRFPVASSASHVGSEVERFRLMRIHQPRAVKTVQHRARTLLRHASCPIKHRSRSADEPDTVDPRLPARDEKNE